MNVDDMIDVWPCDDHHGHLSYSSHRPWVVMGTRRSADGLTASSRLGGSTYVRVRMQGWNLTSRTRTCTRTQLVMMAPYSRTVQVYPGSIPYLLLGDDHVISNLWIKAGATGKLLVYCIGLSDPRPERACTIRVLPEISPGEELFPCRDF